MDPTGSYTTSWDVNRAEMGGSRWAKIANCSVVGIMNEFSFLAEADRTHERSTDLIKMARRLAGPPCSPLHKRHTFPDRGLAALVTAHLPG